MSVAINIVPNDQRMNFLPTYFPKIFLSFESSVFYLAERVLIGYRGGYWEFALTPEGNPFMYPAGSDTVETQTLFGTNQANLPAPLAGLIVTALALLSQIQRNDGIISNELMEYLTDSYHSLIHEGHVLAQQYGVGEKYFNLVD